MNLFFEEIETCGIVETMYYNLFHIRCVVKRKFHYTCYVHFLECSTGLGALIIICTTPQSWATTFVLNARMVFSQ